MLQAQGGAASAQQRAPPSGGVAWPVLSFEQSLSLEKLRTWKKPGGRQEEEAAGGKSSPEPGGGRRRAPDGRVRGGPSLRLAAAPLAPGHAPARPSKSVEA